MADSSFRIKKSAVLVPVASPTLTIQGELAYDSAADKLKVRAAASTDSVVLEAATQTLTNKTLTSATIDADLSTITNIDDSNIKAAAAIDAAKIADGTVSNAEFQYLNGVTSGIQAQLSGKVTGPGSSTDNTLPRFDGTTGAIIQGSLVVVDDSNVMTGATRIEVDSLVLDGATLSSVSNPLVLTAASGSNLVLNASGGGVVDLTGTLDVTGQADVDNINLNGNTISASDTNGNLTLAGNGTGDVRVDNLALKTNTLSSTNTNGNILLDPNGTGVVSVEGGPLRLSEIATPATPASGYMNIYPKSDNKLYKLTDAGVETEIGAGSGSGINYIDNPNAESDTSGWTTYADGSATPVDGTGGSPTLTWARSTSSPLFDAANFLLTPGALGNGVSYDFTIDSGLQASVLEGTLYYQINTPASYTKGDVTFWIYDVTNAILIQPSVYQLDNVIGPSQHRFEFQTASNSTSYRLLVHQATAATAYVSIKMDNFQVGPSKVVNGAITTEWLSYTPTGSWVTNTTYTGKFRRVGDSMELLVDIATTGAPTATNLNFTIPSGYTIDTAKLSGGTSNQQPLGVAVYSDDNGTVAYGPSTVKYNDTTSLRCVYSSVAANSEAGVSNTVPFTWGNTDSAKINVFKLPIVGWGATATLGQDADTRVISATAQRTTSQSITAGSATTIAFQTALSDRSGMLNTSTGVITIPVAGTYQIKFSGRFDTGGTGPSQVRVSVLKTATSYTLYDFAPLSSSTSYPSSGSIDLECVAGDTIAIQINATGQNITVIANEYFMSVSRISGPSQIAASEVVAARANLTTAQTGVTNKVIPFNVANINTHGALNTSTGIFTAPVAGIYRVSAGAKLDALDGATNAQIQIRKNSATVSECFLARLASNPTANASGYVSDLISCVAGDTIDIFVTGDASFDIDSNGSRTFVAISKEN